MGYVPCTGDDDCPFCKLGSEKWVYLTIKDEKTGELKSLRVKQKWAKENRNFWVPMKGGDKR